MAERRFNEDEVAAIFERASETEHTALPASGEGKGLTLAALQDIGREVGISPESIALAAQSLDAGGRPASGKFLGLPIAVGRTVEFSRPITDADWERLVADLRETFNARGALRYDGPFRQWTNGNLQALVEPTPAGHRLRLRTRRGASWRMMTMGMIVTGASAALAAVGLAGGLASSGPLTGAGFIAAMGIGMFAAGALPLPGWSRRRKAQFEAVAARLAITAAPSLQPGSRTDGDPARTE
jgi:hypothetical protein